MVILKACCCLAMPKAASTTTHGGYAKFYKHTSWALNSSVSNQKHICMHATTQCNRIIKTNLVTADVSSRLTNSVQDSQLHIFMFG